MNPNYILNARGIICIVFSGLLFSATLTGLNTVVVTYFPAIALQDAVLFAKAHNADINSLLYLNLTYSESSKGVVKISTANNGQVLKIADATEPDSIPKLLVQKFSDSKKGLRKVAEKELYYQAEYIALMRDDSGIELTQDQIPNIIGPMCGNAVLTGSYLKDPKTKLLFSYLSAKRARTEVELRDRVDQETFLASIKVHKFTLELSIIQEVFMRLRYASLSGPIIIE